MQVIFALTPNWCPCLSSHSIPGFIYPGGKSRCFSIVASLRVRKKFSCAGERTPPSCKTNASITWTHHAGDPACQRHADLPVRLSGSGAAAATDYFREPVRQNALTSNTSLLKIAGRKLLRVSRLQLQTIPAAFVRNFASSVSEYDFANGFSVFLFLFFKPVLSRNFQSEFYVFILIIFNCPQPYFV